MLYLSGFVFLICARPNCKVANNNLINFMFTDVVTTETRHHEANVECIVKNSKRNLHIRVLIKLTVAKVICEWLGIRA